MVPATRWLAVGVLALGVLTPSVADRFLPAKDVSVTATDLARRIEKSPGTSWSGEAVAQGSLQVPLGGSTFGGIARLLGDRTQLRVWWRDDENWRVDRITPTGESDQLRERGFSIRWRYEQNTARLVSWSAIRLPDDHDVVPTALAARLLAGAKPSELTRIAPRRIASRSAAGLRLVPADSRSTIGRVDVWADESTGVPLRVEVYGVGDTHPVLTSEVTTFDPRPASDKALSFSFAPGVDFERGTSFDAVASANAFAPFVLPTSVIDLPRHGGVNDLGAVGVFGQGPTVLLAVPLRHSAAADLHKQLARSQDARETDRSVALEVGPLSVLLTQSDEGNFLLTGTVTPAALQQASLDLARGTLRTFR
jgi:hypothetical protein